jgi:NAD(P)-dependent dehydrogenase (short-subunit alcohol dehydrogenase family)/enamine deaminase RidA (YjgF/YER057c/UK114 family)
MKTLAGKSAVVTGGGRGIGKAVALALAEAGAAVVVASRTKAEVEAVATELTKAGHRAWGEHCDVTDAASVSGLASAATARLGQVDILVNNAGMAHSAPVNRLTIEEWNRVLAVNATGTFLCTQALLPGMVARRWGRVVNVASIAGLSGAKYIAAYSAAKHAVVGFTRCVAAETAGSGVTANAVCPGYVDTEMTQESIDRIVAKTGRSRADTLAAVLEASGQRSLISPAQVAEVVRSLCEEESGVTNGEAIVIDGRDGRKLFELINPAPLGRPRGWTHGVLTPAGGRVLFVAGQTASGDSGGMPNGFVEQWRRALEKVVAVVQAAGGTTAHIGRMTIYVTDRAAYLANLKPLGEVHQQLMGRYYPAMALVEVKALIDPHALVEIEATAVLP